MGRAGRFLHGASFLPRGLWTIAAGRGLRLLALAPIAASALVFLGVVVAGVWLAAHFGGRLGQGGWGTLWAWLSGILAFAAFVVAWFFAFGMFAGIVAAPFNGPLGAAVEKRLTGSTGEVGDRSWSAELLRGALAAAKLLALELAVMLPALLLLLVPFVGALVYAALASFFLGLNYLDGPLDRRRLGLRAKLRFCHEHLAETLGLGAAAYLGAMVPLLNLLVAPAAAAGAARLYLELTKKNG